MPSDPETPPGTYTAWMGMQVILNVTAGETKTSLLCTIIGESDDTVRVRVADLWDVDIYKEMARPVDAFPHEGMDLPLQNPGKLNQVARSAQGPAAATEGPEH